MNAPHPRPVPPPAPRRGTLTVTVAGDLDYETSDDLLEEVRALLTRSPETAEILLDCSQLTLCDSMGLSALLQLRRDADLAGCRLVLDHRPLLLDRLLELTGTAEHLLRYSADAAASPLRAAGTDPQPEAGLPLPSAAP